MSVDYLIICPFYDSILLLYFQALKDSSASTVAPQLSVVRQFDSTHMTPRRPGERYNIGYANAYGLHDLHGANDQFYVLILCMLSLHEVVHGENAIFPVIRLQSVAR